MNKKIWKFFIVTLLSLLAITASQAQSLLTIEGQVLDANLAPLPGVSVKIKGQSIGGSTDANGNYTLRIPASGSHALEFSFVGYESRQLQISASRTVYNVQDGFYLRLKTLALYEFAGDRSNQYGSNDVATGINCC